MKRCDGECTSLGLMYELQQDAQHSRSPGERSWQGKTPFVCWCRGHRAANPPRPGLKPRDLARAREEGGLQQKKEVLRLQPRWSQHLAFKAFSPHSLHAMAPKTAVEKANVIGEARLALQCVHKFM